MDKETLSNYGWIVICVLVLAVMLALATPFGQFIADGVKSTAQGLFDTNQNALDAVGIVMGDQGFDDSGSGGVSTPQTNEYGFYFNQPYQTMMEGALYEYVFYKDGDASLWVSMDDEHMGQYIPTGTCTYEDKTITIGGSPATLSEDGKTLTAEGLVMTMQQMPISTIRYGVSYENINEGISVIFREDGSLEMYQGDTIVDTLPTGSVTVKEYTFDVTVGVETMSCPIYPDGSRVMLGEMVLVVGCTHENTEIKDIEPTCITEGMSDAEFCVDCGMLVKPGTTLSALGHMYDDGVITTAATCTKNGTKTYTCSRCNDQYDEKIQSFGEHDFTNSYICDICGEENQYALTPNGYKNLTGIDISKGNIKLPSTFRSLDGDWYKVTSIGWHAFEDYTGLTSITIPDSVTLIDSSAFYNCTGLTNVTIGSSVATIDYRAFSNCTGLTNVTIPDSVTEISDEVFSGCTNLKSITIPDSVTDIGQQAFYHCSSLTNIIIPKQVTQIKSKTFSGCTSLTNINIPYGVTYIGTSAFSACKSLTSIELPDSVTAIDQYAFSVCTNLTSFIIPDNINSITNGTFSGCTNLTNITIPYGVTKIGQEAFSGCTGLTNINIPNSVTEIAVTAFSGCTGLTNITIPNSVTKIGQQAFNNCTKLSEIKFNGTVEQWNAIQKGVFWIYNSPVTKVVCSNGSVSLS